MSNAENSSCDRVDGWIFAARACYPDAQAGPRKAMICIGALHLGHLKTGLGRDAQASINTCKTN